MVVIKIGKGVGHSREGHLGTLTADLTQKHKKMTIEQIAELLAKQCKIKDGEIELNIEFCWRRNIE